MGRKSQPDYGTDLWQRQRVVRRSKLFVLLPVIILAMLIANLLWSIMTANPNSDWLATRIPRFALTDVNTAASLVGLAVTLVLTRAQWAKLYRPSIAFAIDDEGKRFSPASTEWRCWLSNAGPGGATVVRLDWLIEMHDEPVGADDRGWVSWLLVVRKLTNRGLVDGESFSLRELAAGAALPPTMKYEDGFRFAWFTSESLAIIRRVCVRVCVRDHIGDWHERRFSITDHLPTVARNFDRN
jgi:hypothetical protein